MAVCGLPSNVVISASCRNPAEAAKLRVEALCEEVVAANPKPVADYKAGNMASLNFLKGQVIKRSKGQANPQLVGEILERKLKS